MAFENPIAAQKLLNTLAENTIAKAYNHQHATVISHRGAGKPFQIRYLLNTLENVRSLHENRIFGWLDLEMIERDSSAGYLSALLFFANMYSRNLSNQLKTELLNIVEKESVNQLDFIFILKAVSQDHKITFVIENARKLYDKNPKQHMLTNILMNILKELGAQTTYIFILDKEFSEETPAEVGPLWNYITANIVWDKDVFFDEESIQASLDLHENTHKIVFSKEMREKLNVQVYGDPTTLKKIIMLAVNNPDFLEAFEREKNAENLYLLIGTEWTDERYLGTVRNLEKKSLDYLENKSGSATDFLKNNLIVRAENDLMNPLFDHFIQHRLKDLKWKLVSSQNPKEFLLGQELILLETLERNKGKVVTRDELAQSIWGDDWEEKYSDWALDKIVSNTRKKLEENHFNGEIKTLKGQGLLFV